MGKEKEKKHMKEKLQKIVGRKNMRCVKKSVTRLPSTRIYASKTNIQDNLGKNAIPCRTNILESMRDN